MKNSHKLLLSAILLPLFTLAQSNYKPGIAVTLKGDTLHGFIDYKEWENNPESINFKSALNEAAQQYTPNEITYFQVGQLEAYQGYNGRISMDATNINRISTGRDTSFKTAAVFLKLEQDGKYITLYSYTDDLKKRYFVADKSNKQPVELVFRTYYSPDQANKTVNEDRYKGQLIYLSSRYNANNDDLRIIIENSNYDVDLINVVNKINHNTAKQTIAHSKPDVSFYAGISSGLSTMKPPDNDGNFTYRNISTVNSYLPKIALGINVYTNPEVGKLVFRGEVALSANNFKTYFQSYYNLNSDVRSYFTLNQYSLSFIPQILYNIYNTDNFKFYLDAGVSLNLSKYSNNGLYDGLYNAQNNNYIPANSSWISYPLSAGIILNGKIGIFLTYTLPATFAALDYTSYNTQIGISYTFGQKK